MGYSLAAKFASEAVGMGLMIFIGESVIANELLPSTKGHALGYFGLAMGFGMAIALNSVWFGPISAVFNPASFFALAILGELEDGWAEFAVGTVADFIGAFVGAVLVYLFYAHHFWTVPLPQDSDPVAKLIYGLPDALSDDAGRIASAFGTASLPTKDRKKFRKEVMDLGAKIRGGGSTLNQSERESLIAAMEDKRLTRLITDTGFYKQPVEPSSERNEASTKDENEPTAKPAKVKEGAALETAMILELRDEAYKSAQAADAHAKLSIFCTRPALYNRPANFYQEMIATTVLIFGAQMFGLSVAYNSASNGSFIESLFVGLLIMTLVLGLGGTTGLAINPARDFGPRCAHAVLPIPGKGGSEWHYAWVPFFAPFVGGALGAGVYRAIELLFESGS